MKQIQEQILRQKLDMKRGKQQTWLTDALRSDQPADVLNSMKSHACERGLNEGRPLFSPQVRDLGANSRDRKSVV